MTLFNILNNFIAPSGIFCTPDSHRANVRGETSTCRAAFANDRPRDLRRALSSAPTMPQPTTANRASPLLTSACLGLLNLFFSTIGRWQKFYRKFPLYQETRVSSNRHEQTNDLLQILLDFRPILNIGKPSFRCQRLWPVSTPFHRRLKMHSVAKPDVIYSHEDFGPCICKKPRYQPTKLPRRDATA